MTRRDSFVALAMTVIHCLLVLVLLSRDRSRKGAVGRRPRTEPPRRRKTVLAA